MKRSEERPESPCADAGPCPRSPEGGAPLDGFETVYIVSGTSGEYSDRTEWTVAVFQDEDEAKDYVALLCREYREISAPFGPHPDWDEREAIETAMRFFDPAFNEDYTGTRWFIQSAPLCERGQGPASAQGAERSEAPGGTPPNPTPGA